jgi:2-hydroxy-3-keto-5-methylthiopentenyl-1-phosphate phosphatase
LRVVLDWDGTVTEVDGLHMLIERFGDVDVYEATERALGRRMSLHEVIDAEMRTISIPVVEAVDWVREHVTVRRGFADFARAHAPTILSSGFRELIEPVLEREGVRLEVLANELRPDWTPRWRDEAQCTECGEACKRAALGQGPVVYVGDGYSDRCVALAADRVFARDSLAEYLERRGVAFEEFTDFVALGETLAG